MEAVCELSKLVVCTAVVVVDVAIVEATEVLVTIVIPIVIKAKSEEGITTLLRTSTGRMVLRPNIAMDAVVCWRVWETKGWEGGDLGCSVAFGSVEV